jgi:hypothetical protein
MAALFILAAIAVVAVIAALITASRDGYSRSAFEESNSRNAWPSSAHSVPTHLA